MINETATFNFYGISFQTPEALFLILVLPVICLLFWLYRQSLHKKLLMYAPEKLLETMAWQTLPSHRLGYPFLLCAAWFFMTIALMAPVGDPQYLSERMFATSSDEIEKGEGAPPPPPMEIVFLLDASSSMLVKDTRKGETRFDNAKEIIDTIAARLGGRAASLYAFTSELIPIVPATKDILFLRLMNQNTAINDGEISGTDFSQTFTQLKRQFEGEPFQQRKAVILLSDGGDTSLEGLPAALLEKKEEEILSKLGNLNEIQTTIAVIGNGTEKGGVVPDIVYKGARVVSKMNSRFLSKVSKNGSGLFLIANNETPVGIAVEILGMLKAGESTPPQQRILQAEELLDELVYKHYFQYPLFFGAFCLAAALILPRTQKRNGGGR